MKINTENIVPTSSCSCAKQIDVIMRKITLMIIYILNIDRWLGQIVQTTHCRLLNITNSAKCRAHDNFCTKKIRIKVLNFTTNTDNKNKF